MKQIVLLLFISVSWLSICASHWTCDPHAWQYDMTAYVRVNDGLRLLSDYSDCEVAAMVGDECRGVAQVVPAGNYTYCQVRVRSNVESGERITWRAYRRSTGEEITLYEPDSTSFQSMAVVGTPSAPMMLRMTRTLVADVNGDGAVDVADMNIILNIMVRKDYASRYDGRADANVDGLVDVEDLNLCINIMVRKVKGVQA